MSGLTMKILVQFPTRERKDKFFSVIQQYYAKADNIRDCLFHVVIDSDDSTMNTASALDRLDAMENCAYTISDRPGKVNAINTMPPEDAWDIVLLLSDDMIVQKKGWDTNIREKMKKLYPTTDGVLWYDDGFVHSKLNTLVCMGRRYYNRFGYIYHPSYNSLWCDNEFTDVAKKLKRQTYINEIIIRHEHIIYMNQPRDILCNKNENWYIIDKKNYEKRRALGFKP